MKRTIEISAILLLLILRPGFGQDPQFSQFYANSLYLAPSFAGATEENRLSLNYRDQWPAVPGVFRTYSFSFDRYFSHFNSGLGFLATYDVAGTGNLSTTNLGLLYSYVIPINNEWYVRPGVNFKFVYLGLNINNLIWGSQIVPGGTTQPSQPPPFDNVSDIDFAFSSIAYNDRIWAGFTIDHLLTPKQSFYGSDSEGTYVPVKVNVFGGVQVIRKSRYLKPVDETLSIAGNFYMQGGFYQLDVGLYWYKNPLIFGLWYRGVPFVTSQAGDAAIALVGIKTENLHIGYSYDFTISNLIASTGGSHEISMVYEFSVMNIMSRGRQIHAIPCPEF